MNGIPLTRYQVTRITYYAKFALISLAAIFLLGNTIKAIIKDRVTVNSAAYELKDGFPLFTSAAEYIRLVKTYPHDFGVRVRIHRVSGGESLWMIAHRYHISVDTIIAANQFLTSLDAREGDEIVVPLEEGVLMPVDQFTDAWRMARRLGLDGPIRGSYMHGVFDLFSLDQMRFAFFRNCKPALVNAQENITGPEAAGAAREQSAAEAATYRLHTYPVPSDLRLEASGVCVLPDGRLAVGIRKGEVWILENPLLESDRAADYHWHRFASGLHEPCGLTWHDGALYTSQRSEITRLEDGDGDGVADAYLTVAKGWGVSGNYHEYAYGPAFDAQGNLWLTL
ncbi:MAG TPA: LysM domain-containing protein, partial [Spirochaetota bacterium]|nr:LysM domain-containing protein [Spirochaetota bacterium]